MSNLKVKPCPFCGNKAAIHEIETRTSKIGGYFVMCKDCFTSGNNYPQNRKPLMRGTGGIRMSKCKTIDRLALTRQKFPHMYGDTERTRVNMGLMREDKHREGYSTCPSCGQETLIHEDGCMHCRSCGWSACG